MYLLSYIRGDFVYCPVLLVLFTYIRGDFVYCPVLLVLFNLKLGVVFLYKKRPQEMTLRALGF